MHRHRQRCEISVHGGQKRVPEEARSLAPNIRHEQERERSQVNDCVKQQLLIVEGAYIGQNGDGGGGGTVRNR